MDVVVTTGQVAVYPLTIATSAPTIINGRCIIRIESINGNEPQAGTAAPDPLLPHTGGPYTSTPQWIIILAQNDRAIETLLMGQIGNQPTWENTLAGATIAANDLSVAFQSSGGGGGGIDTIDGGTTGYSFTAGPNSVMSGTPVVPIPYARAIFIDSIDGDDATGTPYRFDLPYQTFAAALADATDGDTIVCRAGFSDTIADAVGSPDLLYIVTEPSAFSSTIGVALTEANTQWSIYTSGARIGDVNLSGSSTVTIHGSVQSVLILGASVFVIFGDVKSTAIIAATATAYFNNGTVGGAVQVSDTSIVAFTNYHLLSGVDNPLGVGVTIDAYSSSTLSVTGAITFKGNMFVIVPASAGNVATASADGSWKWV